MYMFHDDFSLAILPTKRSVFKDPRGDLLAIFLLQVFVTLILCKILAKILSFIHQPAVIGQILAGIILGPSGLGFIPGFSSFLFTEHTLNSLQLVASLGLILFMFYLGLKMDPNEIKRGWQRTVPIALASMIVPVGVGCAVSLWFYQMARSGVNKAAFILFIGSGFGFSAFPVLASILQENNIIETPLGNLIVSIAAFEDIIVWVIVAIATSLSKGGASIEGFYTLLATSAFIFLMFIIVRSSLSLLYRYYCRRNDEFHIDLIVICLLIFIAAAFASELIHIHAFFGAFIAGLIIPRENKKNTLHEFLLIRIELISIEFFLPLYFTNSGLKTHLYILNTFRAWYTILTLVIIASLSKILPVTFMTRLITRKIESWSYAFAVGILMNTRGIVQLVVLNVGVELGVLSPEIFAIFVVTAIILTLFTSPLLHLFYLRKKSDTMKNKIIKKTIKDPIPMNEIRLYVNPIDHRYRKWRLELPSS